MPGEEAAVERPQGFAQGGRGQVELFAEGGQVLLAARLAERGEDAVGVPGQAGNHRATLFRKVEPRQEIVGQASRLTVPGVTRRPQASAASSSSPPSSVASRPRKGVVGVERRAEQALVANPREGGRQFAR